MSFIRHLLHFFAILLLVTIFNSLTLPSAHAEHVEPPTEVKVNVLSAFSTTQERELLYSFRQTLLEQHNIQVNETLIFWERQQNWQQLLEQNQPNLIIVIGNQSYNKIKAAELSTPVLALMLNKSQFESLKQSPQDNLYAITHSQPTERFVQLTKSLNVYQAQFGSFISPQTKHNIQTFDQLAEFYDLSYQPLMVDPKLNGRDVLKQLTLCCSVLIMESDCVFRPGKVRKSILINAYRQRIVVIGHSESVLKEGAMLTLFTQPHEMGEQAAGLFQEILNNSLEQPYQYPKSFTININRKVARLLGYEDLTVGKLIQNVDTLDFIQKNLVSEQKAEKRAGKIETP